MAEMRPFQCVRPAKEYVSRVAALPYDVYNRKEAYKEAARDRLSFLNIDRPETQFGEDQDMYAPEVYKKAHDMLYQEMEDGVFLQDKKDCFYLYELTMDGWAQTGPIFLAYRKNIRIEEIIRKVKQEAVIFDFTSEDGIRHRGWQIADEMDIQNIQNIFSGINEIYIADGHHRAASAVRVGLKRRMEHPDYNGTEEFNYFLSILFPDEELLIMDYNRVVKDLNGWTKTEFLKRAEEKFLIRKCKKGRPQKKGQIMMLLGDSWYQMTVREEFTSDDPVEGLDVSILQRELLDPILGIKDPKKDKRIDFIGGVRGLEELERRVHRDCTVAFAMYPTSIQELFQVADAGRLMPPKSTWFEPKLRSGLFIHCIEQ